MSGKFRNLVYKQTTVTGTLINLSFLWSKHCFKWLWKESDFTELLWNSAVQTIQRINYSSKARRESFWRTQTPHGKTSEPTTKVKFDWTHWVWRGTKWYAQRLMCLWNQSQKNSTTFTEWRFQFNTWEIIRHTSVIRISYYSDFSYTKQCSRESGIRS